MARKINWSSDKERQEIVGFIVDILMVILVIINLAFIVFDWHFGFEFFRNFIAKISQPFYEYYSEEVHPNFLAYDIVFVSIFLTEFFIRWMLAAKRKTYGQWFFYPFYHWYDLFGCIPLGSFRWLRVLRIVSMTIRLHKMGVINITEMYIYKEAYKFYRIFVEEVTDRVVINVLNGVQREIRKDSPVTTKMIAEVIKPHQDILTQWLSHRIKRVTEHNYELYKDDIKQYVEGVIHEAVSQNSEVKNIAMLPVVGKPISVALKGSVSDITFNVVNGMVRDLASDHNNKVIEEVTNIIIDAMLLQEEDRALNKVTKDIFISAIDMIKEQVEVKKWRAESETAKEENTDKMETAKT